MINKDLLKSRGWDVRNRLTLKCFKKDFLIDLIESLESNWCCEIEKNNNLMNILIEPKEINDDE